MMLPHPSLSTRARHAAAMAMGVVALSTLLVFSNTLTAGKVWEDDETVFQNPFMFGWRRIPYLFTTEYWVKHDVAHGGAYRPLVQATFALEHGLWGPTPMGYHLTNALMHVAAVLLCYALVHRLTGQHRLAVIAALLFAMHPTRSEAVGWLKNRAELMCSISMMASVLCFHRVAAGIAAGRRLAAGALAAGVAVLVTGLLCKGLAIVLPALLVCHVWCFMPKGRRRAGLVATLPFWAVVVAYVGFKLLVLSGDVPRMDTPVEIPGGIRLMIPGWTAWFYEKLLLLPTSLCADRDAYIPARSHMGRAAVCAAGLLVACAPLVLACIGKRRRARAFLTAWFPIVLLPYVNVMYIEVRPLAEQRAYLPGLAYCYLLALGCARLTKRGHGLRRAGLALTWLMLVPLASMTLARNFAWRDMFALFHDAAMGAPKMARVHGNLGAAYHETGRLRTAKRHLTRSVDLDPGQPKAVRMLGLTCAKLGDAHLGISFLRKAWQLRQEAVTGRTLGNVYMRLGQWSNAKHWLEESIRIRPGSAEALHWLGLCHWRLGDLDAAGAALERSLKLNPANPEPWFQLGNVRLQAGDAQRAAACFRGALEAMPLHAGAVHNLGLALLSLKQESDAEAAFVQALRMDPSLVAGHVNLAKLYARRKAWQRVAAHMQAAIRIQPRNHLFWEELALALEQAGDLDNAARAHSMTCALAPYDWAAALAAARLAQQRGRYREALRMFAQALKANPELPQARAAVDSLSQLLPQAEP